MMQQIFTGYSAGRNNKKGISLKVFFSFLEKCPAARTVPLNPFPTEVTPEPTGFSIQMVTAVVFCKLRLRLGLKPVLRYGF